MIHLPHYTCLAVDLERHNLCMLFDSSCFKYVGFQFHTLRGFLVILVLGGHVFYIFTFFFCYSIFLFFFFFFLGAIQFYMTNNMKWSCLKYAIICCVCCTTVGTYFSKLKLQNLRSFG
jgi:hypothetical protein